MPGWRGPAALLDACDSAEYPQHVLDVVTDLVG